MSYAMEKGTNSQRHRQRSGEKPKPLFQWHIHRGS